MGPKAWGWTATIGLEGLKAIRDEKVEKWGRQGRGREGRRWKANTLPWFRGTLPPSLIPGKGIKMKREGKKSNLSDWAKGHGALLVNKQPLCNWPWGDKNRKDSTLSPTASAPWQALNYRFSFPIIPPSLYIWLPNTIQRWPGSQGRGSVQGRDRPQPNDIAHSLFLIFNLNWQTWAPRTSEHLWAGGGET